MKLYADHAPRRARQILADALIVLWVVGWIWVGRAVHDATMTLAEPGRRLQAAGDSFRDRMLGAGSSVDDLPILDDRVARPFNDAADAGTTISDAGGDLITAVERLALTLGVVTAVTPILIVGAIWLAARWRFVRRATAAQSLIDSASDLDLFALRAMANQPMPRLAAISPDPAGAWRSGDRQIIHALALLELKDSGLKPPPPIDVARATDPTLIDSAVADSTPAEPPPSGDGWWPRDR